MTDIIVSKAHVAVLVPDEPGVRQMFPTAPSLPGGNKLLVPHGTRETLVLRHLGLAVPNPIDFHYNWAGADLRGKPPFQVQKLTARMLTENPRAFVLNHMGTGKTATALWAWHFLYRQGVVGKLLIVAPLSTLRFVWQREIFDVLPGVRVQILGGKGMAKQQRLDALAKDADIYILNHDGLKVIESNLRTRPDISALVIDELAVYRNDNPRSKRMRKFALGFKSVWGMTGSPMPNEPTDVWAQCMIVSPGRVPKFRSHARDMLMTRNAFRMDKWDPKPDAVERAYSWMQPSCRFKLEDVVELPQVVYRDIEVELSDEQRDTYKRVSKFLSAGVKNKQITAVNAGAAMNKLLQIAGGWVYTERPEFVRLDPTPRVIAMADIIDSTDRKVLIAVPYRHMMVGLSSILSMQGVNIDHCLVHGDTKDRDTIFHLFQNTSKYKAMLCDPRAVHHGLTLTAADTIIWYVPMPSLDIYDQFNARITRIGQKHRQQVMHLRATATEKHVYQIMRDKDKVQKSFLKLIEDSTEDLL